jgi:hypothetical protein
VAFLPVPLTARAVGTISKQAGLSIPGSVVSKQGSTMIAVRRPWTLENINACQGTDFGDW